jgi:hypothetical protein
MDESKTEDAFGGYGATIRTFWFKVDHLQIRRGWSKNSLTTNRPKFYSSVIGRAVSEDRVGVIGRDSSIKDFEFTLGVDTDAKSSWEWHKAHDVLAFTDNSKYDPAYVFFKKSISERLDKNPPTAALLNYDDDWETGIKAGWEIVCQVPPDVFSKIEDEIAAKTVTSILMSVIWEGGLVFDKNAPPSVPTVWGLFCLQENRSPETLHGHVSSIRWSSTNHEETKPKEARDDMHAPTPANVTAAAPVVINIPKSAIAALWVIALAAVIYLFK